MSGPKGSAVFVDFLCKSTRPYVQSETNNREIVQDSLSRVCLVCELKVVFIFVKEPD